jgi:chaperone required for assembly of F1-ATPase
MKRFYKSVTADAMPDGWRILLDGKPVRTPGGGLLLLPTAALADAVTQEWRGQGEEIDPVSMPMLRLANMTLDGIRKDRAAVIAAILRFGEHDLLCYRAEAPASLAERQAREWDAMLDWAVKTHGARLAVTSGVGHIVQPPEALQALESAVEAHDDFALAGLHVIASITGSLVLALALVEGAINSAQAFQMSRLDEIHQAERWGTDVQAEQRAHALAREIDVAAAFVAAACV